MGYDAISSDETFSRSARVLVDESAIEMTTEIGDTVEIWTISCDADTLRASAPRLQVRTGMHLSCRVMVDDTPHHVTAAIETVTASSGSRAALVLRVIESSPQGVQRRSERTELHVPAVVTALVCYRIAPDEPLSAVITDVSEGGLALSVADTRPRENDRLRLRVRVFEGMIDCELRVKSVRPGDNPGNQVLGCSFLECSAVAGDIIRRWIERVNETAAPARPDNVRLALDILPADETDKARPKSAPARLRPAWQL
ncbi:MAG: PilZ domain [Gaiellales bacterium]|jgi:hypothetical protein|nr:PilZ domain [Gaiellales bacterium]